MHAPRQDAGARRACPSSGSSVRDRRSQMVRTAFGVLSMAKSAGMKVLGRWCCGQLNSMPPEIQGPAKPTRAGLMTSWR